MEGLFQPVHLLVILFTLFVCALSVWPLQRILHRAGLSRVWCLLAFVPVVNWIAVWIFAYVRWPATDRSGTAV